MKAHYPPTNEELEDRFSYHPSRGSQAERYDAVRAGCLTLAKLICRLTPGSPDQCLALTALDEVMFRANAAIARNE